MAGVEIGVIAIIIVFGALALPILFNENPAAFLENGLCTIFTPGQGQNTTCNSIKGNVTFVGLNGIDIFANNTENTVFWEFTGNGSGGNGTSKTHVSLGDGDIFKEETATEVRLRGITNDTGIEMTVNATDIILGVKRCPETGLVFFNASQGEDGLYECVNVAEFVSEVIFDNNEFFPPHLSVGGGADTIVTFQNYSVRAIKMRAVFDEDASWLFIIPDNYNNITNVSFDTLWFTDVGSGTGVVCFELSGNVIQPGDDLDTEFNQRVEQCVDATTLGADILQLTQLILTPVESQLTAGDVAILKLERRSSNQGNLNDTFNRDVFVIGGELKWAASP